MAYEAVVIPADRTKPVFVVTCRMLRELKPLVRSTIGGEGVASTRQLPSNFGPFRLWADSDGFHRRPVDRNDRAIRLCQVAGHDVVDLAGTAVVTGDLTSSSQIATVPPPLRNLLLMAFASAAPSTLVSDAAEPDRHNSAGDHQATPTPPLTALPVVPRGPLAPASHSAGPRPGQPPT